MLFPVKAGFSEARGTHGLPIPRDKRHTQEGAVPTPGAEPARSAARFCLGPAKTRLRAQGGAALPGRHLRHRWPPRVTAAACDGCCSGPAGPSRIREETVSHTPAPTPPTPRHTLKLHGLAATLGKVANQRGFPRETERLTDPALDRAGSGGPDPEGNASGVIPTERRLPLPTRRQWKGRLSGEEARGRATPGSLARCGGHPFLTGRAGPASCSSGGLVPTCLGATSGWVQRLWLFVIAKWTLPQCDETRPHASAASGNG